MARELVSNITITVTKDEDGVHHTFTMIEPDLPLDAQTELMLGVAKMEDKLNKIK